MYTYDPKCIIYAQHSPKIYEAKWTELKEKVENSTIVGNFNIQFLLMDGTNR